MKIIKIFANIMGALVILILGFIGFLYFLGTIWSGFDGGAFFVFLLAIALLVSSIRLVIRYNKKMGNNYIFLYLFLKLILMGISILILDTVFF